MKKNQSGFTLIEIAIVMVIIGLLLGGVLKGQAMINSAKVRSLNNGADGVTAAWFAFQDRYRAFPGDMSLVNANAQIAAAPTINAGGNQGGTVAFAEGGAVWQHMAAAGLISGSYTGTQPQDYYSCSVDRCPDNRFGLGYVIVNAAITFPSVAHYIHTGSNIPVAIAAELDRKIDDGLPNTGSVRSASTNGASNACRAGGAATDVYSVTVANADCGLAINSI